MKKLIYGSIPPKSEDLSSGKTRVLLDYTEVIRTDYNHDEEGNIVGEPISITEYEVLYIDVDNPSYENIVEALIRQEYSISDEFAILRQASAKPEEFQRYNDYAEYCKTLAKNWINGILE